MALKSEQQITLTMGNNVNEEFITGAAEGIKFGGTNEFSMRHLLSTHEYWGYGPDMLPKLIANT